MASTTRNSRYPAKQASSAADDEDDGGRQLERGGKHQNVGAEPDKLTGMAYGPTSGSMRNGCANGS